MTTTTSSLMAHRHARGSVLALVTMTLVLLLAAFAQSAQAASPAWEVATVNGPTNMAPGSTGKIAIYAINVGGAATTGTTTIIDTLPAGLTASDLPAGCVMAAQVVTCTTTQVTNAGTTLPTVAFSVTVDPAASGALTNTVRVSSTNAAAVTSDAQVRISTTPAKPGIQAFLAGAYDADGHRETRAGAHPYSAITAFFVNTVASTQDRIVPAGDPRDIKIALPPGFLGNPLANPRCPDTNGVGCTNDQIVGTAGPLLQQFGARPLAQGVYNNTPPFGSPAQFTFNVVAANVVINGSVRSDGDYGVNVNSLNTPQVYSVYGAVVTLWGTPADASHDQNRCLNATADGCANPSSSPVSPAALLTNPTDCPAEAASPPSVGLQFSSWLKDSALDSAIVPQPSVTGCDQVPFTPSVSVTPTSSVADSAAGLNVDISVPQGALSDPNAIAQSQLKTAVVQLPEGVSVNPSAATGLDGCSDDQVAVHSLDPSTCPDGSKIGTATVDSPLLDQPVTGDVYLGTPKSTDPQSGEMFRLFIVARNDRYGVSIKLPGSAVADPATGRLTATFDNNPRLPFSELKVTLKGGSRGILAMPNSCQTSTSSATLTPWSGTAPVTQTTEVTVGGDCSHGFAPTFDAGMSSQQAGGSGAFALKFSRRDGEQYVAGLTVNLPTGLLASLKGVPVCSDAQAAAGDCPEGTRIGTVDATAGSGSPFTLEQKGSAYLTDGYKGCAYGLAVTIPVVAGPFRDDLQLGTINVRQSLCVDPIDAHVTVTSDPLPTIWHGIPLRVRSVTVMVDRPDFMRNPTSCDPKAIGGTLLSTEGVTAPVSSPFQVDGCRALDLKPKLALSLTGKGQTTDAKHPGVDAVLTQAAGQANLKRVEVQLPLSLALDPDNAQALCEFADGSKPTPTCPAGSIVGSATAVTPILNEPLKGPVYFVKNIRIDAKTGRQIKTLPKLVIPLVGEHGLKLTLTGSSAVPDGKHLVTTFTAIPDAPVSSFELKITGGKSGILTVSGADLCKETQVATRQIDGQNGKQADGDIVMSTPCRLATVASSHTSKALKLTVGGIGAGKISVSGKGIAKTSRTIASATTATLTPRLTKSVRQRLAAHRNVSVRVTLAFTPKGAKKAKVVHETLTIHGAAKKPGRKATR
jgi:hypothetical protein